MRVPQVVGENHTPAAEGEKKDSVTMIQGFSPCGLGMRAWE